MNSFPLPAPPHQAPFLQLYTDFDGTLTTADTLSALSQLAKTPPPPPPPPKPWAYFVDAYREDLRLSLPPAPEPEPEPLSLGGSRTTLPQEAEYLEAFVPIERRSIERLEQAGFFAGLSAARLRRCGFESAVSGAVGIRDGWWEVLAYLADERHKRKHAVAVISVNWSSEFIKGVLSGSYHLWCHHHHHHQQGLAPPPTGSHPQGSSSSSLVDAISVYSNDLLISPETRLTTGSFSRRRPPPPAGDGDRGVWAAADKLGVMTETLSSHGHHHAPAGAVITVYMGDSPSDLLCLLKADVGIVVGRDAALAAACGRLGVPVEDRKSTRLNSSHVD